MFHQEALGAQHAGALGEIVLTCPISLTFLTLLAAMMALLVVGFFLSDGCAKHNTVNSQSVSASDQAKVHTPQASTALHKFVREGQAV